MASSNESVDVSDAEDKSRAEALAQAEKARETGDNIQLSNGIVVFEKAGLTPDARWQKHHARRCPDDAQPEPSLSPA